MPIDPTVISFAAVAVAVVVTPGPDMLLVMRNTLAGGRAAGVATVAGVIAATLGWAVLAVVGVAAVMAASATAFTALKLIGAAYLVYLGVSSLRDREPAARFHHEVGRPSLRRAARQGYLSAALNPKLGVFFLTLLPQFADPSRQPAHTLLLAVGFAAIGLAWLLLFTFLVGSLGGVVSRPKVRRRVERAVGVVLIGVGVRVAWDVR